MRNNWWKCWSRSLAALCWAPSSLLHILPFGCSGIIITYVVGHSFRSPPSHYSGTALSDNIPCRRTVREEVSKSFFARYQCENISPLPPPPPPPRCLWTHQSKVLESIYAYWFIPHYYEPQTPFRGFCLWYLLFSAILPFHHYIFINTLVVQLKLDISNFQRGKFVFCHNRLSINFAVENRMSLAT